MRAVKALLFGAVLVIAIASCRDPVAPAPPGDEAPAEPGDGVATAVAPAP